MTLQREAIRVKNLDVRLGNCTKRQNWDSLGRCWQTDSPQQVGVAGVASQRVESGIHPEEGHSIRTIPISLFQPSERVLSLAEGCVYASHIKPTDIPLTYLSL